MLGNHFYESFVLSRNRWNVWLVSKVKVQSNDDTFQAEDDTENVENQYWE